MKASAPPLAVRRPAPSGSEPVVSVIIPTRNRQAMLLEAVEAIARQDLELSFELIVVDDASADSTQAMVLGLQESSAVPLSYLRLVNRSGPAGARNAGLEMAGGRFIAFTDDDCVPDPAWLRAAVEAFDGAEPEVGMVQGRTEPIATPTRIYCRFVETGEVDGTFATANMVFRREALADENFDPECPWWEDTDLGWRLVESGWQVLFAPDALVRHQLIDQTPLEWILWTRRYYLWCANAARHPAVRRHLFLGVWIRPMHIALEVAVLGALLARRSQLALLLCLPYAAAFVVIHNVRSPRILGKALAYLARDLVALASLLAGSIRHRTIVL